jgi:hypothetical protein
VAAWRRQQQSQLRTEGWPLALRGPPTVTHGLAAMLHPWLPRARPGWQPQQSQCATPVLIAPHASLVRSLQLCSTQPPKVQDRTGKKCRYTATCVPDTVGTVQQRICCCRISGIKQEGDCHEVCGDLFMHPCRAPALSERQKHFSGMSAHAHAADTAWARGGCLCSPDQRAGINTRSGLPPAQHAAVSSNVKPCCVAARGC